MSSGTDISYDIPFDCKSNEKFSLENERQSEVVKENVSQVSHSCISQSGLCAASRCESSDTFEKKLMASNLHANKQDLDVAIGILNDLHTQATGDKEVISDSDHVSAKFLNISLKNNDSASASNSVIRQQWFNIEELARETKLLRKYHGLRSNHDRRRLKKTCKSKVKLTKKNWPMRNSVVYNDVFVQTYDLTFEPNSKPPDGEKPIMVSHFDRMGDALLEALNKVAELLDVSTTQTSAAESFDSEFEFDDHFTLYSSEWVIFLNTRARYSGFFEFGVTGVLIQLNTDIREVPSDVIKQFFNNAIYFQFLDDFEFYMISNAKSSGYVAKIPEMIENLISSQSISCLKNVAFLVAFKIPAKENEDSCSEVESLEVEDEINLKSSEDWSDLCSLSGEILFDFPSLRSEIIECAFQVFAKSNMRVRCDFD